MVFDLLEKKIKADRVRMGLFFIFLFAVDARGTLAPGFKVPDFRRAIFLAAIFTNRGEIVLPIEDGKPQSDPLALDKKVKKSGKAYDGINFAIHFVVLLFGAINKNVLIDAVVYIAAFALTMLVQNKRNVIYRQVITEYVNSLR